MAGVLWMPHAVEIVARGEAHDLLWMCNLGGLVLGIGLLAGSARTVAVAASWLALGVPLWALDLLLGGEVRPTSVLSHVSGAVIVIVGVRRLGWPPGSWLAATVALAGLVLVTRLVTPPSANVNLAFAVWPGWEGVFGGHVAYLAVMGALGTGVFGALEGVTRVGAGSRRRPPR